jgi:2-phospho-L-lactate guanylyltransferase (CobY/MobA/RfbA family)
MGVRVHDPVQNGMQLMYQIAVLRCNSFPIPPEHLAQTCEDARHIRQQQHLAVLMADLAAVETAHRAPVFAAHAHEKELGMDAAAGGVAHGSGGPNP